MKKHSGLSLVELMISMALSLILMMGILQIFTANKAAFEISRDINDMQDNAQVALALLAESIRLADHWGGVAPELVKFGKTALKVPSGKCSRPWIFRSEEGLRGYEGANDINGVNALPSACVDAQDYQKNSDLLALRYADSHIIISDQQVDNARFAKHNIVRTSAGIAAYVFSGANYEAAFTYIPKNIAAYNMLYATHLFFLRPCSNGQSAHENVCKDEAPTLMRMTLSGDRFIQQPMVAGIEQMQFDYGVDSNNDHQIDQYLAAHLVERWQQVLSVRISLIVRGDKKDASINEPRKEYLMRGDFASVGSGFIAEDSLKFFRRRLYQREVMLRNRL